MIYQPRNSVLFFFLVAQFLALSAMAQPGNLDPTFGSAGKSLTAPYSGFDHFAMDVAQDSAAGLVVVGVAFDSSGATEENGFVLRLSANGSLDTSFNGGAGVFYAWFDWVDNQPTFDRIEALAIQSNGQIIIAGSTNAEGSEDMLIMRLKANGQVDSSFNNGIGYRILEFDLNGSSADYALDVAVQPDGKIVVVGAATWSGIDTDVAVARLLANGALDTSFAGDGRQTIPFDLGGTIADVGEALALQTDGKIVIAGEAPELGGGRMAFARLLSSGVLDTSFGSGGLQTVSFTSKFDRATGLALTTSGKIIAAGYAGLGSSNRDYAALRLNANGSLDTGFGTSGKTTIDFGLSSFPEDAAYDLALQSDGKALLVGRARTAAGYDIGVVRLTTNGQQDSAFGRRNYDFGTPSAPTDDRGFGALIQVDGKLVAVGSSQAGSQAGKAAALRILTTPPTTP